MCEGGHGVISVTANIVPKAIAQMCEAALENNFDKCRDIDETIKLLHSELFIEPNPVMPKWALYKMGMMESAVMRLPMVLPELSSQKRIEELLKKYALISG
jgi:4-hydroxy-tetrahydrodipicolinate synthase